MKPRKFKMSERQRQWVRDWWRSLQPREQDKDDLPGELRGQGRSDRARLRRCMTAEELLSNSATLLFARRLIALGGDSKTFSPESMNSLPGSQGHWRMSKRIWTTTRHWLRILGKPPAESAVR